MEITNELRAAAFAAYMPCKITDKYANGVHYDFVGISPYEGNLQVAMPSGDPDWWNIDICTLILHRLSDITDEHAIEVAMCLDWKDNVPPAENLSIIGKGICLGIIANTNYAHFATSAKVIDTLRKLGYNTPFRGIDLIESGIAEYVK